jgi:hypothetical protein
MKRLLNSFNPVYETITQASEKRRSTTIKHTAKSFSFNDCNIINSEEITVDFSRIRKIS